MRDRAGSAAAPAARCRSCRRGSFMGFPEIGAPWSVDLQPERLDHQLAIPAENYLNLRRYKRRGVVSPRIVARRHAGVPPRARFLGGNRMLEMTNENFARLLRGLTIAVGNRR